MKKIGLMSAVLMSSAAFAADGIKLGGFADAGFGYNKPKGLDASKGFTINDGAVYFGKTVGAGEVFVDLAFQATTPGAATFDFANAKSQAWISWKYDNGFWWKMGQFDILIGYEANDSWDRFFSLETGHTTLVEATVSNGLLVGYKASDALNVTFMYANPADLVGTSATIKGDIGVKLDLTSDAYTLGAGFIMHADSPTFDGAYGWVANVIAGSKMGMLNGALEFTMVKPGTTGADTGMGFGGHFDYEMSEMTALGASVEWTKDSAAVKTLGFRVGPQWSMNKDFKLRAAFGYEKVTGGTSGMGFGLNALHQF